MKPILEVAHISKKYRIRHEHTKYHSLRDSVMNIFKKHDNSTEEFYALENVSFDVMPGESVGIIGRNGAGKSTLLKILSKITPPTSGSIISRGRIASLLEVGTGFHPELTGRENIFLNGSILGMKRNEILRKFDEIVDFSGVEKFLDTPLKHYSSGMQLRLAFAVAAFLEPEILVIDEVLAVGDAEFQKKCLRKMDSVTRNEGRTILFVSHDLNAIKSLCQRTLVFNSGKIVCQDQTENSIGYYITQSSSDIKSGELTNLNRRYGSGKFRIQEINLLNRFRQKISLAQTGDTVIFSCVFDQTIYNGENFRIDLAIDDEKEHRIGWFSTHLFNNAVPSQINAVELNIPRFPYGSGRYGLTFFITIDGELIDYIERGYYFDVESGNFYDSNKTIPRDQTNIYVEHKISFNS